MSQTTFFPFGAYQKLDSERQAVVDSILLSDVIHGTAKARMKPEAASELEHAYRAVHEAYLGSHYVAGNGNACLSLNRDFLANHPNAIEAVRQVLEAANIQPQLWAQFTRTINQLVELDNDPLKVSNHAAE